MSRKRKQDDPLVALLATAPPRALARLLVRLATTRPDVRREFLDNVLPYIESGNAGLDDALYDVAYAACYDDHDSLLLPMRLPVQVHRKFTA